MTLESLPDYFAKLLGGQGKVFAFEPDEKNFDLLKKNIELNGYKNVTLVPKAVSNKTGKARLYLSEDNLGDHRIYDSHDSRHFIEIETVRLDDYFKDFEEKVDFIKMDVQGSEPLVLEGMQGLLDRNQELRVLSEYWPSGMKKCNRSSEEYLKSLKKNHFELYNINGINHRMKPCHISEILQEYKGDEDYTNLFCIRKQLKDCKVHTEEPEVG
jgi:FkbM family methyltransferase